MHIKTPPRMLTSLAKCLCLGYLLPATALATVFTSNTTINTGDTTYDGQDIVVKGCTLTVNGPHSFNSLIVTNSGLVTHSQSVYNTVTNMVDLTIAGDVIVRSGSAIDVSGKGYGSASGPGKGTAGSYGGGAGYGASGGNGQGGSSGGLAYGSLVEPVDVGSGGGTGYYGEAGGAGGGAARLVVVGTLQVDGSILANGTVGVTGQWPSGGGGSGGSINLSVGTLSGNGTVKANGGNGGTSTSGSSGGGGGGHVAVYYTSSAYAGLWQAYGGSGYQRGGSGTIYLKATADSMPQLILDDGATGSSALTTVSSVSQVPWLTVLGGANVRFTDLSGIAGNLAASNSTVVFDLLQSVGGNVNLSNSTVTCATGVTVSAGMVLASNAVLTLNYTNAIGQSVGLYSGAVLTHSGGQTNGMLLSVVGDMSVDVYSAVDVSGRGYGADSGPGAAASVYQKSGGGAGHGGTGGASTDAAGGSAYDSISDPRLVGSGGGSATYGGGAGGAGGGAVRLLVRGTLTVDGSIRANGFNGQYGGVYESGGGSGGTINLQVGTFSGAGSGLVQAKGGSAPNQSSHQGGGGSGGRVAVYYTNANNYIGLWQAYGGSGYQRGGAGTIYLKASAESTPQLLIDDGATGSSALTTVSSVSQVPWLTVLGGANVRFTDLSGIAGNLAASNSTVVFDLLQSIGGGVSVSNASVTCVTGVTVSAGMSLASNAVLALNYTNAVGQSVGLYSGAVLTHSAGQTNGMLLSVGTNMTVDVYSAVDVSGKGYGAASGPGAGASGLYVSGGGAGHGGAGGASASNLAGGSAYDSVSDPRMVGSGGGSSTYYLGGPGGAGGGVVRLLVGGTLTVDGSIRANGLIGQSGGSFEGGGGSGGSINLQVASLGGAASGLIQAKGGSAPNQSSSNNQGGGGGGGRLAVYCTNANNYIGNWQAYGGSGNQRGGAGTVYLIGNAEALPQLVLDDGATTLGALTTVSNLSEVAWVRVSGGANVRFANLASINGLMAITNSAVTCVTGVTVNASLSLVSNAVLTLCYTNAVGQDLQVMYGSMLTHAAGQTNGVLVNVAGNMTVSAGSSVDVSGKGYGSLSGPGKGAAGGTGSQQYGGGAGYGANGGNGQGGAAGGPAYGSLAEPVDVGSGGGTGYYSEVGGAGGGAARLVVTGTLQVDGSILADGGSGAAGTFAGGGGSGGTINLHVGTLSGAGIVRANGGNGGVGYGTGGGGGGGRVAVYQHCSLYTGSMQAGGGTGYQAGSTGTVYVVWVNAPPTLPSQPNVSLDELTSLTVTNTASDIDCPPNEMTYVLENAPEGATISAEGIINWTPTEAQGPGTYTIKTIVTDYNPLALINQRLSAANSFTVTVNEINVAPVLNLPATVTMDEMTPLVASATVTDPDIPANTFVYELLSGPPGLTLAPDTGAFTWVPDEAVGPGIYTVTAKVTDYNPCAVNEQHLSTTNSFSITVNEVNRPPVLAVPADQIVIEQTPLVVSASATDPDIPVNALTFSLVSPPEGMTIDPASGAIAWTPTEAQGSNIFIVTVVVTDDSPMAVNEKHMSDTRSFTVTVLESNRPPVLGVPSDQVLTEETSLAVSASATDPDIPANPLTFSLLSPPEGMTIDPASGAIAWTPTEAQGSNTYTITVVVTDDNPAAINERQLSATNSFLVTVNESNRPPVLVVPFDQVVTEETPLAISASATDPDIPANLLTFSLLSPPEGMTIDPGSGAIAWTPTEAQGPNTFTVTVVVTDDSPMAINEKHMSDTKSFTVTVLESNRPPVLAVPSDQVLTEETSLAVSASATDPDIPANALTFSLLSPPEGMTIDPVSGAIAWTPTESQGSSAYTITVVVTDDNPAAINERHLSATNAFLVTVNESNRPPVLVVPSDQVVTEETPLMVSASATDPDIPANTLTFSLVSPPEGMTIDPASGAMAWTPTESQGSNIYTITVVVTDDNPAAINERHLSATNTFLVTVNESNRPPVLVVPSDQVVTEETPLTVSASATDPDVPANALTFSLLSPPEGMTIDPASGAIAWTPTEAQGSNAYTITVVVTDDNPAAINERHLSATNAFRVTVNESNRPPVLVVPSDQVVTEETPLAVGASATDPDLPANTLTFSLVSPPEGMSIDAASGAIAWTPTEAQGSNTYTITVVVTDDNPTAINERHLSATNTFLVTVNESNQPPVLAVPSDQAIDEQTLLTVSVSATDPDLPANTLTFSLQSPPEGMSIDAASGAIAWTPNEAQGSNTYTITVVVTDDNPAAMNERHLSATNSFTVLVREVNVAPVLAAQTNLVINELTLLIVTNTASDADLPRNELTYALIDPPAGATIDTNGIITWTPTEAQGPSTNVITTVVTDYSPYAVNEQRLSFTNRFTVTVNESNQPPELVVPTDRTINELELFTSYVSATDADLPANPLTLALVSGPPGMTLDPVSGALTWTPTEEQGPGTYQILISLTDTNPWAIGQNSLRVMRGFRIVVNEVNAAPVLAPLADYSVNPGQTIQFTATASDADWPLNTLTFSLVDPPTGATIEAASGHFNWRPPATLADTTHLLHVRVTDWNPAAGIDQHASDTQSFTVQVAPLPQQVRVLPAPVLHNGHIEFAVGGAEGPDYIIQTSSNMVHWVSVWTNTPGAATGIYTDPEIRAGKKFYRLQLGP
jgi:hypothetical protein